MYCCDKPVATDTIYSDTPEIYDISKYAQLFFGKKSLVSYVYGMKTDKQFVSTFEDNIRASGAMIKFNSDSSQYEIRNYAQSILRELLIDDWQIEPHYQHHNFAESRYHTVKLLTNIIIDCTDSPVCTWLISLIYV